MGELIVQRRQQLEDASCMPGLGGVNEDLFEQCGEGMKEREKSRVVARREDPDTGARL